MPGTLCVIGGGPAGLGAALEGARLGMRVDLYEKARIGENIRCAEGFIDTTRLLGRPAAGVRFKVAGALLKVRRAFRVDCKNVNLWMIDRREWQCHLAAEAQKAGVAIHEGFRVTAEHLREFLKRYDWIVDASGAIPVSSSLLGLARPQQAGAAVALQYVVAGDFRRFGANLVFELLPHYQGYYWIFPKGENLANIGLGLYWSRERAGSGLRRRLERFLERWEVKGEIVRKTGGLIPLGLRERLRYGKILLAGDAAGCASPLHGGGIDTSFLTGVLAARWAARPGRNEFTQEVWRLLGPKLRVEMRLCRLWRDLSEENLDVLAGMLARDYRNVGPAFLARPGAILRGLGAGLSFWWGLTTGNWGWWWF